MTHASLPPPQRRPNGLVFVQMNEINFDVVEKYISAGQRLPAFSQLLAGFGRVETFAEKRYEELEPWIQWVSFASGKTYDEHRVFRLGDAVHSTLPQVYETLEQRGLKVGAVSPMNARNELKHPAYFVPDPWTDTPSDSSAFSRRLTDMLRQTVNENAQGRISKRSLLTIVEAMLRSFDIRGISRLFGLVGRSRRRPWHKALVLDQLIHLVHLRKLRDERPDVSFVFLNAGAHIQHHYFFNSPFAGTGSRNPAWYVTPGADPMLDMIKAYDRMLQDYLDFCGDGRHLIVATGLTQIPYDRLKFYYRLKDHATFLGKMNIRPARVLPRMTRDFELEFTDRDAALRAIELLKSCRVESSGLPLFAEVEDRGLSLFVVLTYPTEIQVADVAVFNGGRIDGLLSQVSFVAIKNGMHSPKGFAFFSPQVPAELPRSPVHVASLFQLTLDAAGAGHAPAVATHGPSP